MTRAAIEDGFREYVDDIIAAAYDAFDVTAALRGHTSQGGQLVSALLKNNRLLDRYVVQPELQAYKADVIDQVRPILDYAEDPTADFEAFEDEVLAHDSYYQELREDVSPARRAEIRDDLLARQRRLGEAAAPLVAAEDDAFWPAVETTLSRAEAESLIETHFAFTEPLRTYPDAFRFDATIDPGEILSGPLALGAPSMTIDFTDEVRRVLVRAERQTIDRALGDVARRYD
jgi:hypothetical protein